MITEKAALVVDNMKGVMLDLSFGGNRQPNSLSYGPGGDVEGNPACPALDLPDHIANVAVVTHVLEYLQPYDFFDWFDELHRVMKPHGVAAFSGPYGGDDSAGWLSDPTHQIRIVEQSFFWLDPQLEFYQRNKEMGRPLPKPWKILATSRVPGANGTISYNITLQAMPEEITSGETTDDSSFPVSAYHDAGAGAADSGYAAKARCLFVRVSSGLVRLGAYLGLH